MYTTSDSNHIFIIYCAIWCASFISPFCDTNILCGKTQTIAIFFPFFRLLNSLIDKIFCALQGEQITVLEKIIISSLHWVMLLMNRWWSDWLKFGLVSLSVCLCAKGYLCDGSIWPLGVFHNYGFFIFVCVFLFDPKVIKGSISFMSSKSHLIIFVCTLISMKTHFI